MSYNRNSVSRSQCVLDVRFHRKILLLTHFINIFIYIREKNYIAESITRQYQIFPIQSIFRHHFY